ncbi:MAG: hypothetical protein LBF40_10010 [Deltaproteobacteria bacterium]|jgi:purine-nucleoside phosphorylase|nr:hypothetical protein [Deltaproteobacteria bacterium]
MPETLNSLWEPPFPFPKGAAGLPQKGILAATPGLVASLKASAPEPLGKLCSIFMLGGTAIFGGRDFFLAGPVLGSAMAVMALEVLIGGGAGRILFAGFAGSLSEGLAIGDLFQPDNALSSEGTSQHYPAELAPDPGLYGTLREKAGAAGCFRPGTVWSTDGPLRETKELRDSSVKAGAIAVEMEVSALFAAARFRGAALAALLLITDSFGKDGWVEGFGGKPYQEGLGSLATLAWDTIGAS